MNRFRALLTGVAALPVCLFANETNDSTATMHEHERSLDEIVVTAERPVTKQAPDRIIYLTKNDPYARGLDAIRILDRIPRVSVTDDRVSVAGKASVRYIIDGHLLEMTDEALTMKLKSLSASEIEKIELLTVPPAKYAAATNVAYRSITTRDETLGTRGNHWGNGIIRHDFSQLLGGSVSHSTRRVEMSADLGAQNINGANDLDRTYTFPDRTRTSVRSNRFVNRSLAANAVFKYKISDALAAGAIMNFNAIRMKSTIHDTTTDGTTVSESTNLSPARPDNAVTLTAFGDWNIGHGGKTLTLTYNFFRRRVRSLSEVTTRYGDDGDTRLTDSGDNRYRIHSVRLDASLPFPGVRIETGAAYTAIGNNTALHTDAMTDEISALSNTFNYSEHTTALYASAWKNLGSAFSGRIGLRYEHTVVKGRQFSGNLRHHSSYGHLFPTINLSWCSAAGARVSASYSMGITRPGFRDLDPFRYYTTVSDWFSGNPDLRPSLSHNAEINFSMRGIYAVLYCSYNNDAVCPITRFDAGGAQYTLPENGLDTGKSGLYASYNRSLTPWWRIKLGGEIFHTFAKSKVPDFKDTDACSWSGKLELNTSLMLNRQKTLILDVRFTHLFPWHDRMTRYSALSLAGCDLRYNLQAANLWLTLSVNDPFGWNVTRSESRYTGFWANVRNDIHSRALTLRLSWTFGREKVRHVRRSSGERESSRT